MGKCIKLKLRKAFLQGFKYTFKIKRNQVPVILLLLTVPLQTSKVKNFVTIVLTAFSR